MANGTQKPEKKSAGKQDLGRNAAPPPPPAGKKPAGKRDLVIRIVLIVVLVIVAITAIRWRGLVSQYRQGVDLYEAGDYQKASEVLDAVQQRTLAVFRIRGEARKALGLCKAEIASDIAMKDRTLDGYNRALKLLEEAREMAGPTPEIERRIKEYSEYKARIEAGPGIPAEGATPPATAPAEED